MLCGVSTLSIANLARGPKERTTCGSFVIRPAHVKGGIVIANSTCRAQGVYRHGSFFVLGFGDSAVQ